MSGPLKNLRHEKFAQLMVTSGMSQVAAYREAGFREGTDQTMRANAARLIARDAVSARIAELRKPVLDKYGVTNDRIIRELALSGFARMGDYAELIGDGDLTKLESEATAAITEFTIDTIPGGGRGANKQPDNLRTRIKLGNKHQALVALAQISGLMKEQVALDAHVTFTIEYGKMKGADVVVAKQGTLK